MCDMQVPLKILSMNVAKKKKSCSDNLKQFGQSFEDGL